MNLPIVLSVVSALSLSLAVKLYYDKKYIERQYLYYYRQFANCYNYSLSVSRENQNVYNYARSVESKYLELLSQLRELNKQRKAVERILDEVKSLKSSTASVEKIALVLTKLNELALEYRRREEVIDRILERLSRLESEISGVESSLNDLKSEKRKEKTTGRRAKAERMNGTDVENLRKELRAEVEKIEKLRGEFERAVEEVKKESTEFIERLQTSFEDLLWKTNSRIYGDSDLVKTATSNRGFIVEKMAPLVFVIDGGRKEYIKLRDLVFVGGTAPFDYMILKGLHQGKVEEIIFVEVKSGLAYLSDREMKFAESIVSRRGNFLKYGVLRAVKKGEMNGVAVWEFEVRIVKNVRELRKLVEEARKEASKYYSK